MAITTYRNFDLLITRAGDRHRAFVVDAPAGEASHFFELPFAPDEVAGLGGVAQGVRRHIRAAAEPCPAANLTDLGSRLFATVFAGKVGTLLAASLGSVAQEGERTGLRLRFEEDAADLALLPWEILYDPDQGHFLGLGEQSPILRYLALPRSRSALLVEPPLHVLALLSSPAGLPPLDMEREWQAIQHALAALVGDGKFVLERLASPTLDALQQRLLGEPVHILHFVGHGLFDEASQSGSLALEDRRGQPDLVRGEDLAKLLRNHPAVRLAYFNACEGALASGGSVFAGVAQALVQGGVPAAVAMRAEISDAGAIELARTFYTALAMGRPVDAALTQARVALSAAGSPEWAIPVLFSRSPDNRLFDIRQVLPTPDCPYPGMVPFSEAQQELFYGRDQEIEETVERLRQHPFLTVVGPSGCGKSSLVYAGVIPALRRSRRFGAGQWAIQIMRPSDSRTPDGKAAPRQALANLLNSSPDALADCTFAQRTLLLVDQFEELFTLAEADEAQAFFDVLGSLMGRPNLHILLTVRADFYPELMACSLWQPIRANRLELPPLGDDELWAAIVEPAGRVGVTVDEALAVRLIADAAGERGALPLVQETLVLLWEKVKERQLGLAAYRGMAEGGRSGLQVAIDRRASSIYDNLPATAQPLARRIFLRLIQFGEGRADTRRQQTVAELRASGDDPALFDQTLAPLIQSRLLTAGGAAGDPDRRVDIGHEALIAGWPRLQGWLGQRRVAEQTRRRLEGKAAEWVRAERRGGLLDEYELQEAENWLAGEDAQELGYSQELLDLVKASKESLAQARAREVAAVRSRQRTRQFEMALVLAVAVIALVGWFWWQASVSEGEAVAARATAETNEKIALTAQAAAVTAAAGEATQRVEAEAQSKLARTAEATAVAASAEALAAKAEVERLNRSIQADRLTANALKIVEENPPLALLLAVEGMRAQNDITQTYAITHIRYDFNQATYVTETRIITTRETVVGSAQTNMHELLGKVGGIPLLSQSNSILDVMFSPDGRWLATRSFEGVGLLWDMTASDPTWVPIILQGDESRIEVDDMTFSKDGHWLATRSFAGTVVLWDMTASIPSLTSLVFEDSEPCVSVMAFSPDNHWLVTTGSIDDSVQVWDMTAPTHIKTSTMLRGQSEGHCVVAVAFSPDGRWLVTGTSDGTAQLWNMMISDFAQRPIVLQGHKSSISSVAFSPNGDWLATGSDDSTIQLWDVTSNSLTEPAFVLLGHELSVSSMAFSSDGKWLATGSRDSTARLWDMTKGNLAQKSIVLQGHVDAVSAMAYSPDGRWLATASDDGDVRLWDMKAANPFKTQLVLRGHTDRIVALTFSPDGRWLATGSIDGTSRLWDANRSKFAQTPIVLQSHEFSVSSIAFSPDLRWLAAGSRDATVRLWDMMRTDLVQSPIVLKGHMKSVETVAFSPDSHWLATGSYDGFVRLWDVTTGDPSMFETLNVIDVFESQIEAIDFSHDGQWLAVGLSDGNIQLWNIATSEPINVGAHRNRVIDVAFSPDGRWLATGSADQTTYLWDLTTINRVQPPIVLEGHTGRVEAIDFSPSGRWLVTGSEDSTATMWDMIRLASAQNPIVEIKHRNRVNAVSFSPDGQWLATGSSDGTVRLWDVTKLDTSQPFVIFSVYNTSVNAMAFSSDGRWLATGSSDGTIRLWTWRVEDMINLACRAAGRNLSYDEWQRYFQGEQYRRTCDRWPIHPSVSVLSVFIEESGISADKE